MGTAKNNPLNQNTTYNRSKHKNKPLIPVPTQKNLKTNTKKMGTTKTTPSTTKPQKPPKQKTNPKHHNNYKQTQNNKKISTTHNKQPQNKTHIQHLFLNQNQTTSRRPTTQPSSNTETKTKNKQKQKETKQYV